MEPNLWIDLENTTPHEDSINNLTLVGKVLSAKVINFAAINAILSSSWDLGPNITINSLDRNIISCTFKYKYDMDRLLEMGPWAIK